MSNLLLNNKPFHLSLENLPCMIHGRGKTGASFFTMNVVLDLLEQKYKVVFYSAYQAARDFLTENVPGENLSIITSSSQFDENKQLLILMRGEKDLFMELLRHKGDTEYIFVIKNIEELDKETVEEILTYTNIIVSGDCGEAVFSHLFKDHAFKAHIFFSDIQEFVPEEDITLQKYQGYYIGKGMVGLQDA